jgi:hypothetical protein
MIDRETKEDFEQTIERLKKMKARIRGCCIKSMVDSLLGTKEERLLPSIQQKVKEYGFKEDLKEISVLKWYPFTLIMASIFSFYEVLDWTEEDVKKAGRNCPRSSGQFVFRTLAFSMYLEGAFKMLNHIWKRLVGLGEIESVELNKQEKYAIARVRNFPVHPLCCVFLEGFGEGFGKFLIQAKKFWCKESKCSFKGDPYHEFILRWE